MPGRLTFDTDPTGSIYKEVGGDPTKIYRLPGTQLQSAIFDHQHETFDSRQMGFYMEGLKKERQSVVRAPAAVSAVTPSRSKRNNRVSHAEANMWVYGNTDRPGQVHCFLPKGRFSFRGAFFKCPAVGDIVKPRYRKKIANLSISASYNSTIYNNSFPELLPPNTTHRGSATARGYSSSHRRPQRVTLLSARTTPRNTLLSECGKNEGRNMPHNPPSSSSSLPPFNQYLQQEMISTNSAFVRGRPSQAAQAAQAAAGSRQARSHTKNSSLSRTLKLPPSFHPSHSSSSSPLRNGGTLKPLKCSPR